MSVKPRLSRWARSLRFASSIVMSGTRRQSQLQYIGDTRIQALISMYLTGDDRLVRQAISHFDASRIPEGITASRYPSDLGQYIPTFSLIWVAMVHDYWMHRDDAAYVRGLFQALQPADEHDGGPCRRGSRHGAARAHGAGARRPHPRPVHLLQQLLCARGVAEGR